MWWAALSQSNGAAYLLMFFLGSLVLVTSIHAHFALAGLRLRVTRIEPVFAGGTVQVPVEVFNPTRRPRFALAIAPRGHVFKEAAHVQLGSLEAESSQTVEMTFPAPTRGRFELGRLALTTLYPMGFFRSWRYEPVDAEAVYLVYPIPAGSLPLPTGPAVTADTIAGAGGGGDDYTGTRPYQAGESQRHVDWRAVARGLIKQFAGTGSRRLWFEYSSVVHLDDVEKRLSQLCRWIVDAERSGYAYGLRLPGYEAEPARGKAHSQRCLAARACFEPPPRRAGTR